MEKDCKKYYKQKKYGDYKNFKDFTEQPSFHLTNSLLIITNLLGIIYLQFYELKLSFLKQQRKEHIPKILANNL